MALLLAVDSTPCVPDIFMKKTDKTEKEQVLSFLCSTTPTAVLSVPSVTDSRVLAKCGTQRGNLLGTALEVCDASTLLAGVVVELECVGRV